MKKNKVNLAVIAALIGQYIEKGERCMTQSEENEEQEHLNFWDGFHNCAENLLRDVKALLNGTGEIIISSEVTPANEQYDKDFEEFRKENPDWNKYLTDSTYYEIMEWYENKYGLANEEHYTDEARNFAYYIWMKYINPPKVIKVEAVEENLRSANLTDNFEKELEKEFNRFLDNIEGVPRMWHSEEQVNWAKDIAGHFTKWGAKHFGNGQKYERSQLMKNAIPGKVVISHGEKVIEHPSRHGLTESSFPDHVADAFSIGEEVNITISKSHA